MMTFSSALDALKQGHCVARSDWRIEGMFLYLVDGSTFNVNRPPLDRMHPAGTKVTYHPHIDIGIAQGDEVHAVPYVALQGDLLADDWELVD